MNGLNDCPKCGLTNPPEAIRCDCGFNLKTGRNSLPATNEIRIKDPTQLALAEHVLIK